MIDIGKPWGAIGDIIKQASEVYIAFNEPVKFEFNGVFSVIHEDFIWKDKTWWASLVADDIVRRVNLGDTETRWY